MPWYMWIATYSLIGSVVAFSIIPEKSLLFAGICLVIGVGSYLFIKHFPCEFEDKDLEEHKRRFPEQYKNDMYTRKPPS